MWKNENYITSCWFRSDTNVQLNILIKVFFTFLHNYYWLFWHWRVVMMLHKLGAITTCHACMWTWFIENDFNIMSGRHQNGSSWTLAQSKHIKTGSTPEIHFWLCSYRTWTRLGVDDYFYIMKLINFLIKSFIKFCYVVVNFN